MAQSKHKKASRPKRQESGKKHGKQADLTQFRLQLDALGLKIIEVTSDGNCFFRALADQLDGNEEEHNKYRCMVVQYIVNHRDEFEPFIEDEVPFDEYCKSMEEDGTWAGNMELQAASLVTKSNICIHRLTSPRWYIRNFASHDARMIHLSYHYGEHYNSVRLTDDPCSGAAKRITIKVDADVAKASDQAKAINKQAMTSSLESGLDVTSVKLVMCGTGCDNYSKAEQILKEVNGDVDAAIEYLIAEQSMDEEANTNDGNNNSLEKENERSQHLGSSGLKNVESDESNSTSGSKLINVKHDNKKVLKEKKPPQGSKKKQKMTVQSTLTKTKGSLMASVINDKSKVAKGKQERRNLKKGAACNARVPTDDHGNLPDVGALCI